MMAKFRKKPVVIEAVQFEHLMTCEELYGVFGIPYTVGQEPKPYPFRFADRSVYMVTPGGETKASVGDWIIRGVRGEYYPCKPDIFEATYERVIYETEDAASG